MDIASTVAIFSPGYIQYMTVPDLSSNAFVYRNINNCIELKSVRVNLTD